MRIVFVVPSLTKGGAERAVAAFANALAEMGEDVHIVCLSEEKPDYFISDKVHLHIQKYFSIVSIVLPKNIVGMLSQAAQLRKLSADVLIPFVVPRDYWLRLWLTTVFSKTSILYTVRANEELDLRNMLDHLARNIAWPLAQKIWVQVPEQRQFFPERMQKKIFEVHNILDDRFLQIPRERREKIRHFISAGRLQPQKNHEMLIRAFIAMIARTGNQDATLTIYGKARAEYAETELHLRDLIAQNHLEDRIFLPGRVTDIEAKYEEADAFILSSNFEGCPNALMEAMAAGLPCISTDCPTGPSAIIESGANGLLVPVGDPEAMSRAMEYLIENPQIANDLGMAAKQRMREWGNAKELASQLLAHLHASVE